MNASLGSIMVDFVQDGLRPPERLTVSESAAKYRRLNNAGAYAGPWLNETTPYLVEPMNVLTSREFDSMVFVGPAQSGKPIHVDTPIATPSGWTTMGALQVGDVVFDDQGLPCSVLKATPVFLGRPCYRITFDDKSEVITDEAHRWQVCDMWAPDPRASRVKTTGQMFEGYKVPTSNGRVRYRYSIDVAKPLQLPEVQLDVPPYVLGLWLGDGSTHSGSLTLNPKDSEEIAARVREAGGVCRVFPGKGNSQQTADRATITLDGETLVSRLKRLGFCGSSPAPKRIPPLYLRASEAQRRALLRGLMDTDGHVEQAARVSISSSYAEMANDIYELLVSLGYKVGFDSKDAFYTKDGERHQCRTSHRMYFMPYEPDDCFSLSRQIRKFISAELRLMRRRKGHASRRFIHAIEPVESVPVRCIAVDASSHLFLCGRQMVPTHNTDLWLNWVTHSVICDPMDMILYQTSQTTSRDFSKRRLDRLHDHTTEVGSRLLPGAHSDNVFDKQYRSGMLVTLSWPAINELSGRPVPRVWLTDYDRMPQNVDGEGSPFDLARKRTTTFGGSAMTVAESSPGFIVDNPKWIRATPHEAPPCKGVLALYNRGDRRRWFWCCPHCGHWFEPDFSLLRYDRNTKDALTAGESAMMLCPNAKCGCFITPDMKPAVNRAGRWVRDGQWIDAKGFLQGMPFRSKTASFWLKGVAAAFAPWSTLVSRYVQAEQDFMKTGEQEVLKSVVNTDLGEPYYLRGSEIQRTPDQMKEMAESRVETDDDGPRVPSWVRFLVATVDIQKNRFVVQVHGVGPRKNGFKLTVVDYFPIIKSNRIDDDGERLWVKPAAFPEDWELLKTDVFDKRYAIEGLPGASMGIAFLGYDTGGREGVTNNAYDFYRWMRKNGAGEHARLFPLKGDPSPHAPRVAVAYPDSKRKDRHATARGEIPVLMFNPNLLKDALQGMIDRAAETSADGKSEGMADDGIERSFTWPDGLPEQWYAEICVEIRTAKGWECPAGARNEAWDLSYYALGICLHLRCDRLSWDSRTAPGYSKEHDSNPFVLLPGGGDNPDAVVKPRQAVYSPLSKLAESLA